MKQLFRILLNVATALSLVLGVATVVLWVRGVSVSDELAWTVGEGRHSRYTVMTAGNILEVGRVVTEHDFLREKGRTIWFDSFPRRPESDVRPDSFPHDVAVAGLHLFWNDDPSYQIHAASIPMWLVVTVFMLGPAFWFLRRQRRRRAVRAQGREASTQCAACGYDLRATPDRCPECGAAPPAQPARPGGAGG